MKNYVVIKIRKKKDEAAFFKLFTFSSNVSQFSYVYDEKMLQVCLLSSVTIRIKVNKIEKKLF